MEKQLIQIRDMRDRDWIWTSKELLFNKNIDGNTFKVYCGLSAYANNDTQHAFPSIDTLAIKLNISRNTIMKALGILENYKFIKIEKTLGEHNVYILLSINENVKDIGIIQDKKIDESVTNNNFISSGASGNTDSAKSYASQKFEKFWNIYPNHANKKTAEKKFLKLNKETILKMVADVMKRKVEHDAWIKGFIPHLSTYINQERWNDPIVKSTGEKKSSQPVIHPEIKNKIFEQNNETRYNEAVSKDIVVKSVGDLLKV